MKSVKISALLDERDNYQFSLRQSFDDAYNKHNLIFADYAEEVLDVAGMLLNAIAEVILGATLSWVYINSPAFHIVTGWLANMFKFLFGMLEML